MPIAAPADPPPLELDEDGELLGHRDRPQVRGRRDDEPVDGEASELRRVVRRRRQRDHERLEARHRNDPVDDREPILADREQDPRPPDRAGRERADHESVPLRLAGHDHGDGLAELGVADHPAGSRSAARHRRAADEVLADVIDDGRAGRELEDRVDVVAGRVVRQRARIRRGEQRRDGVRRAQDLDLEHHRPDGHGVGRTREIRCERIRDAAPDRAGIPEPDVEVPEALRVQRIDVVRLVHVDGELEVRLHALGGRLRQQDGSRAGERRQVHVNAADHRVLPTGDHRRRVGHRQGQDLRGAVVGKGDRAASDLAVLEHRRILRRDPAEGASERVDAADRQRARRHLADGDAAECDQTTEQDPKRARSIV